MTDGDGPTWWDRQLCRNSLTLWAGSWICYGWAGGRGLYDDAMIRFWPYGLFPGEWKDLVFGPSKKNEGDR